MGFVIKSAFWLGIVYSAMPFGEIPPFDPASEVGALVCGPAGSALAERLAPNEVSSGLRSAGCAAAAVARAAGASSAGAGANPDSRTAPARGSVQSLNEADREPPWIGRERRATPQRPTQGWRATRPPGYGHVAVTHTERQTVDD
jgi:hypothetical protein